MNAFVEAIEGVQEVIAICPCCGDLFRLVEAKFIFPRRQTKSCAYLELVAWERDIAGEYDRLLSAEDRFSERLERQRQHLVQRGRKEAKRRLKKIDPTFSARKTDPHDVKAIFDPVEYVVFHGLSSGALRLVEFLTREPDDRAQEAVVESIDKVVREGDVAFEVLRIMEDGSFNMRSA